jgi:hypothetical protein
MKTVIKLTDKNMQTHNGCQWVLGEWKETNGEGELCGPGWLHGYSDPLIAVLHNPIHADISDLRMFMAEVDGKYLDDNGLKCGYTRMRLIEEIPVPVITTTQRAAYTILCAKKVCTDIKWNAWADKWLSGVDRSSAAAEEAWAAAAAARAAEEAAAWAAAAAEAAALAAAWAAAAAEAAALAAEAAALAAALAALTASKASVVNTNQPLDLLSIAQQAVKNY